MNVRGYLGLYGAMWRNSVAREMVFKTNFLLWIVVETLWFALQVSFIAVLFRHTDQIGDWTRWQVILLVGVSQFIQQVFQALFLSNLTQLSDLVRTGRLDFLLLVPVNTRFLISLRQVDLGGFANAVFALVVMGYALRQMGTVPGFWEVAGFAVLVVAGVTIHYALMFLLASVSFWTVRAQGMVWGYYNMFNIARLPDAVFHGAFKVVFTFLIPMVLVANVPAKLLAGRLGSARDMGLVLGMALVCFGMSEVCWRSALRRYTSASA